MADYILNHVIVEGTQNQIKHLLAAHFRELSEAEQLRGPFVQYEFLWQEIIPMPDNVANSDDDDEIRLWQSQNWSCISIGSNQTETNFGNGGSFNFRFPTAWAEPRPIYEKLVAEFPQLKFYFASVSMPNFCLFIGTGTNGKLTFVNDEYD